MPVLGKPFRNCKRAYRVQRTDLRSALTWRDQILGFGAELYWNFGIPGIVVGYFLLGFAVRRFDDRVEAAADALASYSWSYCGTWVAFTAINSISVLAQIITYFFSPVFAMFVVANLARSRTMEVQS